MSKRQSFLLIFIAFLLACVLGFNHYTQTEKLMSMRAVGLVDFVLDQKEDASAWLKDNKDLVHNCVKNLPLTNPEAERLRAVSKEDFALLWVKNNKIIFWSNNSALPPHDSIGLLQKNSLVRFPQSSFYAYEDEFDGGKMFTLIPVQHNYGSSYGSFWSRFTFARPLERGIIIKDKETPYPIQISQDNAADFWIDKSPQGGAFVMVQWYRLFVYFLFLLAGFTLINEIVVFLARRYGNFIGGVFFAGAILIFTLVKQQAGLAAHFPDLQIFISKFPDNNFGSSLGDWLITIGIALWLMIFFHREFQADTYKNFPLNFRKVFSVLYYFAMMACTMIAVALFRTLVFYSGIEFDFDNLLDLDMYGFVGLCGIILALSAMFLFSHRMMGTIFQLGLNRYQRVTSLLVAAVFAFVAAHYTELTLNPSYIIAFCLMYVIAFDYFFSIKGTENFVWVVAWIALFAVFSSLLLYRYGNNRDENQRLAYAKKLSVDVDSLALQNLVFLQKSLAGDPQLNGLIPPLLFEANAEKLHDFILRRGALTSYIFQHYDFQSNIFSKDGAVIVDHPPVDFPKDSILKVWEKATPSTENPNIRSSIAPLADKVYIVKWDVLRDNEVEHPAELYAIFYHKKNNYSRVYSDIFFKENFKGLEGLDKYSYEVSQDGVVRYRQGKMRNANAPPEIPPGKYAAYYRDESNWLETLYRRPDGRVTVRIGRTTGGQQKRFYLFSALFTLLSFFLFVLASLNSLVRFLPDYYHFIITTKGSLAKRIQYFTVALIFISMIVVGGITYYNFKDSSSTKQQELLDQKTQSLVDNIHRDLEKLPDRSGDSLRAAIQNRLLKMSQAFDADVHLYNQNGELQSSSRHDLYTTGLLQPRMGTNAFWALSSGEKWEYFEDEKIGNYDYKTKYIGLYQGSGQERRPIAYLGMPYFLKDEAISTEVSDFFGRVLSVYVCLLLIAAVMTVITARAITKPLEKVVENIKKLQLADKNEPLEIDSDGLDELATLIDEYNRMVAKLEKSTKNIIMLEREGAWRQMARQVAHEITNPLTTMKLSMQQLERLSSSDRDADEIRAYLKKTILRQIEQIDGLAQIASEFSMFAKMDLPQKLDIELNNIVQSVFDLFEQREDVDFELEMPEEQIHILGEKNHLIRVFNNLVINATQAFPSDLVGKKVKVSLTIEKNVAVIRVKDNGTGIPEEIQQKVFEPNFTTKTSGSGLGLAICKRIIDALDGDMSFETKEGVGTEFIVRLPIAYTK